MAMRKFHLPPICMLLAGLLAAGAALAQSSEVYQWKDADGVTHYSDAPPAKGQFQSRDVSYKEGTPVPSTASTTAVPPTAPATEKCTLARTNLERLNSGGDIGLDEDGDGNADAAMDAAQRAQQTRLAEIQIKTFCTPAATTTTP